MTNLSVNDLSKCITCRHSKRVHDRTEATEEQYEHMCWGCWDAFQGNAKKNSLATIYHPFKLDGLDYMERIYEDKGRP